MTEIQLSPEVALPRAAVSETFGIIASKGKGKTNCATVFVEELHSQSLPVCILDPKGDWWGLRSSADGKKPGLPFVIFGGDHGDVPLEPTAGALLADLIVDRRIPCVLDLSLMSKTKARSFTTDFAERLYHRNRESLMLVVDEADILIPQRASADTARLLGAMEDIAKRGRKRGIGLTVITQRPQEVAKSVLDLCETLILLGMSGPRSIKAIREWIEVNVDENVTANEVIASLPSLPVGEAWVWSPAFLRTLTRTRIRLCRTFDSHKTPEPGARAVQPATVSEVDLDALGAEIAATVERARNNDPRELRRQLAAVTAERDRLAAHVCESIEMEVPLLTLDEERMLRDIYKVLDERLPERTSPPPLRRSPAPAPDKPIEWDPKAGTGVIPRATTPAPVAQKDGARQGQVLGKTERAILTVLVIHGERTHSQLALQTGYSAKASTIGVSLSKLRKLGYVEPNAPIRATDAGHEALGSYVPLPTGGRLLDWWLGKIGGTERKVLLHLCQVWPNSTSLTEVCEATGYSPTASTVGVAMSKLRKLELAQGWQLSPTFAEAIELP